MIRQIYMSHISHSPLRVRCETKTQVVIFIWTLGPLERTRPPNPSPILTVRGVQTTPNPDFGSSRGGPDSPPLPQPDPGSTGKPHPGPVRGSLHGSPPTTPAPTLESLRSGPLPPLSASQLRLFNLISFFSRQRKVIPSQAFVLRCGT